MFFVDTERPEIIIGIFLNVLKQMRKISVFLKKNIRIFEGKISFYLKEKNPAKMSFEKTYVQGLTDKSV